MDEIKRIKRIIHNEKKYKKTFKQGSVNHLVKITKQKKYKRSINNGDKWVRAKSVPQYMNVYIPVNGFHENAHRQYVRPTRKPIDERLEIKYNKRSLRRKLNKLTAADMDISHMKNIELTRLENSHNWTRY